MDLVPSLDTQQDGDPALFADAANIVGCEGDFEIFGILPRHLMDGIDEVEGSARPTYAADSFPGWP